MVTLTVEVFNSVLAVAAGQEVFFEKHSLECLVGKTDGSYPFKFYLNP